MNTCPNCGKIAGLHSSILQGCMCQYSMQAPPQQEPVVGIAAIRTWFKDGRVVTQTLCNSWIDTTPPQQEPVAWMDADGNVSDNNDHKCFPIPLYTTPPQRTWAGLTDEEIFETHKQVDSMQYLTFANAIEAKLKERNT